MQRRKAWDFLHTTVPANLLRNKLTSVFPHKSPNIVSHFLFTHTAWGYYSVSLVCILMVPFQISFFKSKSECLLCRAHFQTILISSHYVVVWMPKICLFSSPDFWVSAYGGSVECQDTWNTYIRGNLNSPFDPSCHCFTPYDLNVKLFYSIGHFWEDWGL